VSPNGHDLAIRIVPIDLVIFDCGGVLVDSEAISDRVLAEMLSEQGLVTTPADARRDYRGKILRDVVRIAERRLGDALPDGWAGEFERKRAEAFARELLPVPGAAEVVTGVRAAGVEVCVASQGTLAKTRLALGLTGLRRLFDDEALFSAESIRRAKPHPDLLLYVADCRECAASRCAVVEDSPSGIKAAVSAKMPAFAYAGDTDSGERKRLKAAGAKEVMNSLEELPELLGL
jgi:HAD superfamily hydrolase (TIGR01509 family)